MSAITRGGALLGAAFGAALVLSACGDAAKQYEAGYNACLSAAKANPRFANAKFEAFDRKFIGASAGDEGLRVSIPYELNGQKGVYQCIAEKLTDGTYKAVF